MSASQVEIDKDLEPIIATFIENIKKDINILSDCILTENNIGIVKFGHKLKGSSGSYGFHDLSEMFDHIEQYGEELNYKSALKTLERINNYINNMKICFVEVE